jgi:hypothetical protein
VSAKAAEFTPDLIAPCGMNCALCGAYQAYINRNKPGQAKMTQCTGCRARGKMCAYIKKSCDNLRLGKITYCFECADFPCAHLAHLDQRYRTNYSYSMIETLKSIKSKGMVATLKDQREQHKCPRCGGVISIHNGKCYRCDEVKNWRGSQLSPPSFANPTLLYFWM